MGTPVPALAPAPVRMQTPPAPPPHTRALGHWLGAHRSVWLNEAVLQFLGIFPLPREAESLQLAHLSPQDIGQGTHAPHSSCPRVRCRTSARAPSHQQSQTRCPRTSYSGERGCGFLCHGLAISKACSGSPEYRFPERKAASIFAAESHRLKVREQNLKANSRSVPPLHPPTHLPE